MEVAMSKRGGPGVVERVGTRLLATLVGAAAGLGLIITISNTRIILVGVALMCATFWVLISQPADRTARWLVLFVWSLLFAELLPLPLAFALEFFALVGSLIVWLYTRAEARRGSAVVGWAVAILIYAFLLLLLHPNVPDLNSGLLGYRQANLALGGLILGAAILRTRVSLAEITVTKALLGAMVVSIVAHLWIPDLESAVARGADSYTAMLDGEARLQGIFAGPFHTAMAGAILIAWGMLRIGGRRSLSIACLLVGGVSLALALVRTGYIAVAVIAVAMVIISRSGRTRTKQGIGIAILAGLGYFALVSGEGQAARGAFTSIADYSTDQRFLTRIPQFEYALEMFSRSVFFGWGPGAAGDTLGPSFIGREHVTAHNFVLKVAVEGGVFGLALWFGLLRAWWHSLDIQFQHSQFAVLAVLVFLTFGTTGSAIDALPVSFFVFFFAGLAVEERSFNGTPPNGLDSEDPGSADRSAVTKGH